MQLQKDEVLNRLAEQGNVAQFVAFRPEGAEAVQTYSRLRGIAPNLRFASRAEALAELLDRSGSKAVNLRSYMPSDPRSREFVYGVRNLEEAVQALDRLTGSGLHVIANETIDVSDGGVSGVVQGDVIEFAPDDTPRCVEKPGVASLPFDIGMKLLTVVYGFRPELYSRPDERTEFSIHPAAQGWKGSHTILWEHEIGVPRAAASGARWPNRFSQFIGDKAFGLIMAHLAGLAVPRTLVVPRRAAPFWFGTPTGSPEVWTRTCPTEPHPGRFTTAKGWTDPFALVGREDPDGKILASVLRQDAVPARFSGAAIVDAETRLVIEGIEGEGDGLMLGHDTPKPLPEQAIRDVSKTFDQLQTRFGPVRFEWVHDGRRVWIVQLHLGATVTSGREIVPGRAEHWVDFHVEDGLEALRTMLGTLARDGGVNVVGEVGVTSHMADVLRRAGAPARTAKPG